MARASRSQKAWPLQVGGVGRNIGSREWQTRVRVSQWRLGPSVAAREGMRSSGLGVGDGEVLGQGLRCRQALLERMDRPRGRYIFHLVTGLCGSFHTAGTREE